MAVFENSIFSIGEKLKKKMSDCVELYDSFIHNLSILFESNQKVNRLMNVNYAEDYQANLDRLVRFLGENRKMWANSLDMLSDSFLKVFEYHNRDSQKFLNVARKTQIFTNSNRSSFAKTSLFKKS